MHGIEQITQMDIFYHDMNYSSKGIVDAASRGAFTRKGTEEAIELTEELAKRKYIASSEASGNNSRYKTRGVIKLNKMTTNVAKIDAS